MNFLPLQHSFSSIGCQIRIKDEDGEKHPTIMHAVYSASNYSMTTSSVTEKTNALRQKTWLLLLYVRFLEYCSSTQHYSTAFFPKIHTYVYSTSKYNG